VWHFLRHHAALKTFPVSLPDGIIGHGSLSLESGDSLHDFISQYTKAAQEMFGFIEFVRLEYCSTRVSGVR
jgi:hypothetical protein